MAEKRRKVTLAVAREVNGKKYKADDTVEVSGLEARDMIRAGVARDPKSEPQPVAAVATTKGSN